MVRQGAGAGVSGLPWIHKDPFDRLLVAQAMVEGIELLTVDATLAQYPAPIRVF
jgi:PIN domain nuclease of toxin-antitoxin system